MPDAEDGSRSPVVGYAATPSATRDELSPKPVRGWGYRIMWVLAQALSVLTHPLLLATYLLLLLLSVNPYLFGVNTLQERLPLVALVFGSSFLVPGLVILMMRGLEIIPDLSMPAREHRTLPLLAMGALYIGLFAFCRKAPEVPVIYAALVLGCSVAIFMAFFLNLYTKISLHAVGMGGLLAAVLITTQLFTYDQLAVSLGGGRQLLLSLTFVLLATVLLAGLVGTVRMWLGAHELEEVAGGYLVGFVGMGVSVWVWF